MAKFKGAKWAQILTLMAAIAASIVSEVASAKSYADGLVSAIAAGDVAFSSSNFTSDNVGGALEELFTSVSNVNTNAAVSISTSTGNSGIFLKVNTAPTGADAPVYEYVDVSGLVEYVTSGSQAGDMIFVTVDPNTHQVTATITDGTITKAKLVTAIQNSLDKADSAYQKPDGGIPASDMATAVQTSLGKADSALQDADFEWASDSEINTAWANALAAAKTPANSGE